MEINHYEDLSVDWKIILKCVLTEVGWKGVDWANMALDSNKWQDAVETLRKFQVS